MTTEHFDHADRAYFREVALWALSTTRVDALDVDPAVAAGLVHRLSLLPAESARMVADRVRDPRTTSEPLSDALVPVLADSDDATRQRFAAIMTSDPAGRAAALAEFFAPPTRAQVLPTDLSASRTDARSAPAMGCTHCDAAGCSGCVRTDTQDGEELLDDLEPGEQLIRRAARKGRREADRALRSAFGTDDDIEPDESGTNTDESGTELDDDDATETRATRRKTRTDGDSPMPTRRDDIRTISQPSSPGEQRAARERLSRSVDTEIRESNRSDAADRERDALLDDTSPFVESPVVVAAHEAAIRRAHAVGRTTTRTDAKDAPRGTFASPADQRRRFHLDDDGGGNEAA
jgi:hypothetical protein